MHQDHVELCNLAALDRRDLAAALRDVTRASARVLNVRRVGFWSFHRHGAGARRLGLSLRVVREPLLGHDVDVPADLCVLCP